MAYQLVTASTDLTTKGKRLLSWSLRATAAAVVNIRNASASGDIVIPLNIGLNVSASQAYPTPQGIVFPDGVYVEVVSGTVVGSVDII
jgi:hypothetical protein